MKKKRSLRYGRLERKDFKWIYLFLLPSLVVFALFYAEPIFVLIRTSFTKWDGFNPPSFIGLKNYVRLFTNSAASMSLKNLLYWTLIALVIHVGYGVVVAFIWFFKPKGWKLSRAVYMIPNVISPAAFALIFRFLLNNEVGTLNVIIRKIFPEFNVQWFSVSPYAFWAVTFIWLFYAVVVSLVVYNDLMAIPSSLTEAAKLDGASSWAYHPPYLSSPVPQLHRHGDHLLHHLAYRHVRGDRPDHLRRSGQRHDEPVRFDDARNFGL